MFSVDKKILVKLSSPMQMVPVFNELGIRTKDKDGKDSIKENVITKTKHEFVDIWLDFQEAKHRVTTFGQKIYDRIIDGRVYTSFNPMVDTARLSCRKGSINFLNFPSDSITRDCFQSGPGTSMIVCDYSAQEGVIMADLSKDDAMMDSVLHGVDLHCLLAKAIFPELEDLSDEEIATKHKDKRTFAKPVRFAFSYGGNGFTIHQNLGMPKKEGERIYSVFRELHSGLYEWGDQMFDQAVKRGYIESVDGWKLKLPRFDDFLTFEKAVNAITREEWQMYKEGKAERQREYMLLDNNPDAVFTSMNQPSYDFYRRKRRVISDYFSLKSNYQRLCLNNPVQTRGAHQLKLALCYIFEWILENNFVDEVLLCNSVHDEVVLQSPDELAEEVSVMVGKKMVSAGNHYLKDLKIKADSNIGSSWYA
jgi:DNA polymerase I-like protein with 3'-5' exonuclease and polymerase domains